jgi:hypothetical protein
VRLMWPAQTEGNTEEDTEMAMKTHMIVGLGAVVLVGALALSTVSGAVAQARPTPVPGGMMGPGGAMGGGGMMGFGLGAQVSPLQTIDAAKQAFQSYVTATGNPDLALDEVIQFQWNYYAIVKEQSTGLGAFELLADPRTGAVFPEMGPNMMWNTKYSPMATLGGGMMGGMGGMMPGGMMSGTWGPTAPTTQPSVTSDQAQQSAQQWLDQYQPGSTTETPDAFAGYYTVHITRDGQLTGMLSVNAYTGQVWFHTWHGTFVTSSEA